MTEEIFTRRREMDEYFQEHVRMEDKLNELERKVWDLEEVMECALEIVRDSSDRTATERLELIEAVLSESLEPNE